MRPTWLPPPAPPESQNTEGSAKKTSLVLLHLGLALSGHILPCGRGKKTLAARHDDDGLRTKGKRRRGGPPINRWDWPCFTATTCRPLPTFLLALLHRRRRRRSAARERFLNSPY
ncbi:hypothetical protein LX32DRAFT_321761 [Colletotrichum zoysiae]|uniref:Uncharacterized protein n=1 Tax=Colletotrichum zoysiae TaxID=1216348 RepID=A0AAD9HML5_9PEZI|nr:hypothetical protein LX32DRAFT_321761 [Colletotrichum zoysiae]